MSFVFFFVNTIKIYKFARYVFRALLNSRNLLFISCSLMTRFPPVCLLCPYGAHTCVVKIQANEIFIKPECNLLSALGLSICGNLPSDLFVKQVFLLKR